MVQRIKKKKIQKPFSYSSWQELPKADTTFKRLFKFLKVSQVCGGTRHSTGGLARHWDPPLITTINTLHSQSVWTQRNSLHCHVRAPLPPCREHFPLSTRTFVFFVCVRVFYCGTYTYVQEHSLINRMYMPFIC